MVIARRNLMAGKPLPYDAEVEWIETDPTFIQGVITDYFPKIGDAIYGKFLIYDGYNSIPFGCAIRNGFAWGIFRTSSQYAGYFRSNYADIYMGQGKRVGDFDEVVFQMPSYYYIAGRSLGYSEQTFYDATFPLAVMNWTESGTLQVYSKTRCYSCYAMRGAERVLDLIPVRVNGEGAMYDRVSGQLFRNAGTGAFVIGPDAVKFSPTAKDYVQDGLIAMWDGIENAGWGVHDSNATVWKDLSGNGHDFVFSSVYSVENTVSVYPNSAVATMPNGIVTVELSLSSASGQRLLDVGGRVIANRCSSSKAGMQFDNGYGCYLDGDGLNSTFACDYSSIQTSEKKLWLNGSRVPSAPYWTPWPPYEPGTLSQNWSDTGYIFTGSVRFLRFYNRSLSDAEIAANYAIDKARFNLP